MSTGKRVVVTGMGAITPIGSDWSTIEARLRSGRNAVQVFPEWDRYRELNTRLGAPVTDFTVPAHYPRKKLRSQGRVSLLATRATEMALADAGLLDDPSITDGRMGIAYGSSTGSTSAIGDFGQMITTGSMKNLNATSYIQMMSHTAAVNVGLFFGLKGRVIPTSSACTSGSQGIGYAYEAIRFGRQQLMVAGGAEELCPTEAAVFDTLFATSTRNGEPSLTPRPFDSNRDGLVIGEGAGSLILEELEHALARGAHIHAEIVGFACNSDGAHITQPEASTIEAVIRQALADASLSPEAIGYVNAHGTATERGDIAESTAAHAVFGARLPVSSLKSYTGHTLGACGAIESIVTVEMMNRGWYHPTLNLQQVDPACAALDYITGCGREMHCDYVMNNNFAFGGINTSLIFRRWG